MKYYVFRINYGDTYSDLVKELFDYNRLRQGWGCEGMDIRNSYEQFLDGWKKAWGEGETVDEKRVLSKYRNLRIMLEIEPGDYIIIPKVNKSGESWRSFTIARCKDQAYSFELFNNDFGHIITVESLFSCSYDHDDASRTISGKFKAYQSALNRVYDSNFISAVDDLLREFDKSPESIETIKKSSMEALLSPTSDVRTQYYNKIIERINLWNPTQLESIITELFEKNGYIKQARNQYDGKGGDIDIVFSAFVPNSLMSDVFGLSSNAVEIPQIRVQAKNKTGNDYNDKEGVKQLLQMQGDEQVINVLINTTGMFSDTARELAGRNVVLINGMQFAALLVKYGLDAVDVV